MSFVKESYKIRIDTDLDNFKSDGARTDLSFPATLNNTERRYVHERCLQVGLISKSRGKGEDRYLTVKRKTASKSRDETGGVPLLDLGPASISLLKNYFQKYPVTQVERNKLDSRKTGDVGYNKAAVEGVMKRKHIVNEKQPVRNESQKVVEKQPLSNETPSFSTDPACVLSSRKTLPIWSRREEILYSIHKHDITIITGETGCGKSTQVPQFLLELPCNNKITCTQPRRISAISLAERVSMENSGGKEDRLGNTVGYSVRLDSMRCDETRLVYCTTGVLLREISMSNKPLHGLTHVVMDEVHERDISSDFLLTILRQLLVAGDLGPLKLVLMSATMQVDSFSMYFSGLSCNHIHVPGALFTVKHLFLEDILAATNFVETLMKKNKKLAMTLESLADQAHDGDFEEDFSTLVIKNQFQCSLCAAEFPDALAFGRHAAFCTSTETPTEEIGWKSAWQTQQDISDDEEIVLISNKVSQEKLVATKKVDGRLLESYQFSRQLTGLDDDTYLDVGLVISILELIVTNADKLDRFHSSTQRVGNYTHNKKKKFMGSVLIFLAGWDDITTLTEELESHPRFGNQNSFSIMPLHSGITSKNQKLVFKNPPPGVRKIICSTNIAETSVTIDDVVYVIDAGVSKSKRYDPHTNVSSLTPSMIAQANAKQRSGRAGRCQEGICLRLYSKVRFDSMIKEEVPEMQRSALEEVCLQACLLLQKGSIRGFSIRDFLGKCPSPPIDMSIQNALVLLNEMKALDGETLTSLGKALAKLPLSPRVGKMVLVGTIFGAADIATTLAAFSGSRNPFVIPMTSADSKRFASSKMSLSQKVNSDHYGYWRAFEEWNLDKRRACSTWFLSQNVMNSVGQTKRQINQALPPLSPQGNLDVNDVSNVFSNATLVNMLACLGTFPNIAVLHPGMKKLMSGVEKTITTHKSSALSINTISKEKHMWVVFEELVRNKRFCTIASCTEILMVNVLLFFGHYTIEVTEDSVDVHLAEWLQIRVHDVEIAIWLGILRSRFETLLDRAFQTRRVSEHQVLIALLGLLESERTGHFDGKAASIRTAPTSGNKSRRNAKPKNDSKKKPVASRSKKAKNPP